MVLSIIETLAYFSKTYVTHSLKTTGLECSPYSW